MFDKYVILKILCRKLPTPESPSFPARRDIMLKHLHIFIIQKAKEELPLNDKTTVNSNVVGLVI